MDDNNFKHLDAVLARVKRRTVEEVAEENARFLADARAQIASKGGEENSTPPQAEQADDVRWDEWVDAEKCEAEV